MAPAAIPLAKQVAARAARGRGSTRCRARAARADGRGGRTNCSRTSWRRRSHVSDVVTEEHIVAEQVTRVDKPWGYELHWAKTDRYVGKLIHVNAGHALSLQYHNQKDETIFLPRAGCCSRSRKATSWSKREMMPGEASTSRRRPSTA